MARAIAEIFHVSDQAVLRRVIATKMARGTPCGFTAKRLQNSPHLRVGILHRKNWLDLVTDVSPDFIFSACSSVVLQPQLHPIIGRGTRAA